MSRSLQDYRDDFAAAVADYACQQGITLSDGSDYHIPDRAIAAWTVAKVMERYADAVATLAKPEWWAIAQRHGMSYAEAVECLCEVPSNISDLARIIATAERHSDEKTGLRAAMLEKRKRGLRAALPVWP